MSGEKLDLNDSAVQFEQECPVFQRSLTGEYLAMGLMFQSIFGILAWSIGVLFAPQGLAIIVAGIWILCRARGYFCGRWFTPLVTLGLVGPVYLIWQGDLSIPHPALNLFSPQIFLAMLGLIVFADFAEFVPRLHLRMTSLWKHVKWKQAAFWSVVLAFVVYMILIPTSEWITNQIFPSPSVQMREYLSFAEMVRLRSMEAFSAFWFFAFGATIGSFLNVVAYRVPRGQSVVFQRSSCPQCGTQIKGRDNVPIFGWLMLGGRCRACHSKISARYPIVELTTALLFLTLYFVELISGGANIPVRQPNTYSGVVWILMYTKWDLIGMYAYHCLALCVLLSCVLIDMDGERVNSRTKWSTLAMLLLPPLIWPHLMPVPLFTKASSWLSAPSLQAGLQCFSGCLVGALLGFLTKLGISSTKSNVGSNGQVVSFLAVVGITLGWQAVIAVTVIGLLLRVVASLLPRLGLESLPITVHFFVAFFVHHIVWRFAIEYGAPWWPSHLTSVPGWLGVAMIYGSLLVGNRYMISGANPKSLDKSYLFDRVEREI